MIFASISTTKDFVKNRVVIRWLRFPSRMARYFYNVCMITSKLRDSVRPAVRSHPNLKMSLFVCPSAVKFGTVGGLYQIECNILSILSAECFVYSVRKSVGMHHRMDGQSDLCPADWSVRFHTSPCQFPQPATFVILTSLRAGLVQTFRHLLLEFVSLLIGLGPRHSCII